MSFPMAHFVVLRLQYLRLIRGIIWHWFAKMQYGITRSVVPRMLRHLLIQSILLIKTLFVVGLAIVLTTTSMPIFKIYELPGEALSMELPTLFPADHFRLSFNTWQSHFQHSAHLLESLCWPPIPQVLGSGRMEPLLTLSAGPIFQWMRYFEFPTRTLQTHWPHSL